VIRAATKRERPSLPPAGVRASAHRRRRHQSPAIKASAGSSRRGRRACASQNSHQGVRPKSAPSRRGISRCKSLIALGIQPRRRRNRVEQSFHRWYENGTGRYSRPEAEWDGDFKNVNHYLYAIGNPVNFWDPDGRRYFPPPVGGFVQNYSECPILAFGDPSPFRSSEPIIIRPGSVHFFGLIRRPGRSPQFGDIDFVCLGGKWIKIRGPATVDRDRRLHTILPSRPANADERRELPPCEDPPCNCTPRNTPSPSP